MKKILIVSAIAAIGLSSVAFAGGLPEQMPAAPCATCPDHFELIGALGIAQLRTNDDTALLGVTSDETDRLERTNSNSWDSFAAQLGGGYVYYFNSNLYPCQVQWFPTIEPEVNLYYLGTKNIKGDVWRFNSYNPDWNQLTYEIPVHSTRLMLDVALTVASWNRFSFYAKGGIGNAWNTSSYSDTDKDATGRRTNQRLNLDSSTHSAFAWELGGGFNFAFNDRVGLSLEYLWADLGKGQLSASGDTGTILAPQVVVPDKLNLKAQSLLLGLHIAL